MRIKIVTITCLFSLLLAGCRGWRGLTPTAKTFPAPPTAIVTPTPHYTPLAGDAYVVKGLPSGIFEAPARILVLKDTIPGGTRVEITAAVWSFWQNQYGISACYFYYIHVPGTDVAGWMQQDDLVEIPGICVPYEYRCAQGDGPTPTPAVAPLTGFIYVNVPETVGVPGSDNPNMPVYTKRIYTRGVPVWILGSHWIYYRPNQEFPTGMACYMYNVRKPGESEATWLPEDVLSVSLEITPRATCFQGQIPSWFINLSYPVPRDYEVVVP